MIKDTINPMELDFIKNLHGHVRVETRSRWTGKVIDSQEKDNLVTSAIAKQYRATRSGFTPLWNYFSPIYSKALGGLLVFDTALTESADNVKFPGSAKLVGFAGQGADTTHSMAGSLNESESTLLSNGFTSVWDFLTSQANGIIASVARTSYQFANAGFGYGSNIFSITSLGPYTWGQYLQPLGYDATNKLLYLALSTAQTYNGVTYSTNKIYKTYCDFETQPLINQYLVSNPDRWTEVTTVSSSTDGTSSAYQFVYDPYSDNFYYGASGSTKKIYLISTAGARSSISVPANISDYRNLAASENYYWYIGASNTIYQVKKSNPADSNSVVLTFTPQKLIALADDCIMAGGATSSYNRVFIYSDLTVLLVELGSAISTGGLFSNYTCSVARTPMLLGDYMALPSSSNNSSVAATPMLLTGYLGTIANLDSPVTKTSSQTMKITYTLTEA